MQVLPWKEVLASVQGSPKKFKGLGWTDWTGRKMSLNLLVFPLKMRAAYWLVQSQRHKRENTSRKARAFSELLWGDPWGRTTLNQVLLYLAMNFSWFL